MMPHSLFGIRVRGCRIMSKGGIGGRGKAQSFPRSILAMLSAAGAFFEKITFWKKLYRQGRRG
jgi:hypothetical protein